MDSGSNVKSENGVRIPVESLTFTYAKILLGKVCINQTRKIKKKLLFLQPPTKRVLALNNQ